MFKEIKNLFSGSRKTEPIVFTKEGSQPVAPLAIQKPVGEKTNKFKNPFQGFLGGFKFKSQEPIVFAKDQNQNPSASPMPIKFLPTPQPSPDMPLVVKKIQEKASPQPVSRGNTQGQPLGRTDKFKAAYNPKVEPFVQIIQEAAQKYGVPADLLLDIAAQESMLGAIQRTSGYHPTQRSASGLFQFVVPTWAAYAQRYSDDLGIDVPPNISQSSPWSDQWKNAVYSDEGMSWVDRHRMDPRLNAFLATMVIRDGGLNNWDASRHSWGAGYKPEELEPFTQ